MRPQNFPLPCPGQAGFTGTFFSWGLLGRFRSPQAAFTALAPAPIREAQCPQPCCTPAWSCAWPWERQVPRAGPGGLLPSMTLNPPWWLKKALFPEESSTGRPACLCSSNRAWWDTVPGASCHQHLPEQPQHWQDRPNPSLCHISTGITLLLPLQPCSGAQLSPHQLIAPLSATTASHLLFSPGLGVFSTYCTGPQALSPLRLPSSCCSTCCQAGRGEQAVDDLGMGISQPR